MATDHAADVIQIEWKIILIIAGFVVALVGIIQGLISYIYITGQRDLKQLIEKLFANDAHLEEMKLSKTDHEILCERVKK